MPFSPRRNSTARPVIRRRSSPSIFRLVLVGLAALGGTLAARSQQPMPAAPAASAKQDPVQPQPVPTPSQNPPTRPPRAPATPTQPPSGNPQTPAAPANPAAPGNTLPGNTQPGQPGQTPAPGAGAPTPVGGPPPVASTEAPRGSALPARGGYRVSGTPAAFSVFAVSTDAQELFTAIAARADLRLVVDDTVSRRITVNLTNKPARQIVEDIASAYGLSIADVEGVTMISEGIPRSPSSYLLSDIDAIPTKYVNAANARNLLPVFLQDYVKVNSEQNAVVLSAPTEVLGKFREDIAQFDTPASQILVELLLVELTDATVEQLGLSTTLNNANIGGTIDPGAGQLTFRALASLPQQFSANLRALQEKGKARVRANPRIATVSGRRASIFVGRQRYVVTPIEGERGGSRNFIDAGVRLEIVPYTGGQGQILVDIEAEVSTLSAPDPITRLPEKSTRTAETVVRVADGQTIVIGGLTQQESRDVRTKVPILGDIPLLGPLLFQTRDTRTTQTELALFITPRILSDTGHLPAAEEGELRRRFLDSDLSKPLPPGAPRVDPAFPPSLRLPGSGSGPLPIPATPATAAPPAGAGRP